MFTSTIYNAVLWHIDVSQIVSKHMSFASSMSLGRRHPRALQCPRQAEITVKDHTSVPEWTRMRKQIGSVKKVLKHKRDFTLDI